MKENLFLLKELLKTLVKFTNTWLQYKNNVYIDKLDDIVNEYNNICHTAIKMKQVEVRFGKLYWTKC